VSQKPFVAYHRVSTDRQGRSGLGLEAQRKAVMDFTAGNGWTLIAEYTEVESGRRNDRPQLVEALKACRKHKATLVIAKLDRLARNVAFVSNLMEAGVDFVAADMPHANRLTIHILAAVAEHEREAISNRTKVALAAAKTRGTRLGNPSPAKAIELGGAATRAKAEQFAANVRPIIEDIRRAGVDSCNGIAKALNARGVKAARGGLWSSRTVANVMTRGA
jgi:DNA invertase Pin-like site-specific DNA recombinase